MCGKYSRARLAHQIFFNNILLIYYGANCGNKHFLSSSGGWLFIFKSPFYVVTGWNEKTQKKNVKNIPICVLSGPNRRLNYINQVYYDMIKMWGFSFFFKTEDTSSPESTTRFEYPLICTHIRKGDSQRLFSLRFFPLICI
jgi:hypothetical protein